MGGLSAAISIKDNDPTIEVVVHEKYKTVGYNHEGRRCGEAHSVEHEWEKWKPTGKSIFNTILHADVTIGNHHYVAHRPPGVGFILNRQEFICQLARDAEQRGAQIQTNDKIQSITALDGDVIVDASGCPSMVKRELNLDMRFIGKTYQETLENANCFVSDTIRIVFSRLGGYFWVFPRDPGKNEVNVGVGMFGDFDYNLQDLLQEFKQEQHIMGTVNYVVGGLIPLGLQRPFLYKNILFVGDTGVGAFPFSGQGIYRALMSGEIAGRCIAQKNITKYPRIIRKEFMQWDVMGSFFIRTNLLFRKINPVLFYHTLNFFARGGKELQLLTH